MSFAGTIVWRRRTPRRHMAASGEKMRESRCLVHCTGSVFASEWRRRLASFSPPNPLNCLKKKNLYSKNDFSDRIWLLIWSDAVMMTISSFTSGTWPSRQCSTRWRGETSIKKDASDKVQVVSLCNNSVSHCFACTISCGAKHTTLMRAPSPLGLEKDRRRWGGRERKLCAARQWEEKNVTCARKKKKNKLNGSYGLELIIEILYS